VRVSLKRVGHTVCSEERIPIEMIREDARSVRLEENWAESYLGATCKKLSLSGLLNAENRVNMQTPHHRDVEHAARKQADRDSRDGNPEVFQRHTLFLDRRHFVFGGTDLEASLLSASHHRTHIAYAENGTGRATPRLFKL